MVVQKAEFNKSGRNASVVKMKLKNLLSGPAPRRLPRRREVRRRPARAQDVTYSYFADPMYVFMDAEFNQYDVEKDNMGDALFYLDDGLPCEITFYDGKAISVELPTSVVREVAYTEPAVRGDTSGKVLKPPRSPAPRRPGAAVRGHRRPDRDRHPHRRVPPPRLTGALRADSRATVAAEAPRGAFCFGEMGSGNGARSIFGSMNGPTPFPAPKMDLTPFPDPNSLYCPIASTAMEVAMATPVPGKAPPAKRRTARPPAAARPRRNVVPDSVDFRDRPYRPAVAFAPVPRLPAPPARTVRA